MSCNLDLTKICFPDIFIGWEEVFDEGFRADIMVADKVILELKSLEQVSNSHKKQLLTYLRLSGKTLGYLLNFGEVLMKNRITRIVNGLDENF